MPVGEALDDDEDVVLTIYFYKLTEHMLGDVISQARHLTFPRTLFLILKLGCMDPEAKIILFFFIPPKAKRNP